MRPLYATPSARYQPKILSATETKNQGVGPNCVPISRPHVCRSRLKLKALKPLLPPLPVGQAPIQQAIECRAVVVDLKMA